MTTAKVQQTKDAVIQDIARKVLLIETLEERKSDSLDFHEVGVLSVREALEKAFEAGRQSNQRNAAIKRTRHSGMRQAASEGGRRSGIRKTK